MKTNTRSQPGEGAKIKANSPRVVGGHPQRTIRFRYDVICDIGYTISSCFTGGPRGKIRCIAFTQNVRSEPLCRIHYDNELPAASWQFLKPSENSVRTTRAERKLYLTLPLKREHTVAYVRAI